MKNWKTTLLGIVTIAGSILQAASAPNKSTLQTIGQVSTGVGLILSKDADAK